MSSEIHKFKVSFKNEIREGTVESKSAQAAFDRAVKKYSRKIVVGVYRKSKH